MIVKCLLRVAVGAALLAASVLTLPVHAAPAAPTLVRVVVPEHNLQYVSFWLAQGAGYFADEGLTVQVVFPAQPMGTGAALVDGTAEVAILAPPMYLELIAQQAPVLLFANLLRNDPINLVVSSRVAEARSLSADAPLVERLQALRGVRMGIASGPPTRLRSLYASVGLNADQELQLVVVPGPQQNTALAEGRVEALYAHTPYLETALVEQGAVLLVNQSNGEIPAVAACQVHTLATLRPYAAARPDVLLSLTRAVARAQELAHTDLAAAAEALQHSDLAPLNPAKLETLLALYAPAIPDAPVVSVAGTLQELGRFPASATPPDLTGIDLDKHLALDVVQSALETVGRSAGPARPAECLQPA